MLWDTVRHAVRRIRRCPGYAIPVIASLTLGIGLNTAVFSELAFVLRRPLPYPQADDIVAIGLVAIRKDSPAGESTAPNWTLYKNDLDVLLHTPRTLQSVAAYFPDQSPVRGRAQAEYVTGAVATTSLLRVLRIAPSRGRWFTDDDSGANVVVLSHSLWQRQFAADVNVVGQTLRIREQPWTVIGVMPEGVGFPTDAEYWTPLRGFEGQIIGRLNAGVTREQVAAEFLQLSPGAANLMRGGRYSVRYVVEPLHDRLYGPATPALRLIFVAALLLFLIACANVANLALARALERRREFAVRTALGATRTALASTVGVENAILALGGALVGAVVSVWGVGVLVAVAPEEVSRLGTPTLDALTIAFAIAAALVAALLVSMPPIILAAETKIQPLLGQAGQPGAHERIKPTMRRLLVSTQIALAMVLVTAAGLVIRSLGNLTREARIGFSAEGVVVGWLPYLPWDQRDEARRLAFAQSLAERLRRLPGVRDVAFGPPPLVGGRGDGYREGFSSIMSYRDTSRPDGSSISYWIKEVDAHYLDVFRLRLRSGRNFQVSDDMTSAPVVILTARSAKMFFGDRDPIGQPLNIPLPPHYDMAPRVIGVVDDILQRDLALEAFPEILIPIMQRPGSWSTSTFAVVGTTDPWLLTNAIRAELRDMAPNLAAARLEPMQAVVDASARRYTFILRLLSAFAALGAVLAAIGVYSVIAYLVARRRVELGVRLALGARGSDVVALVMREGVLLTIIGVLGGTAAALGTTQLLKAFLFDVTPHDAPTFLIAPFAFAIVAVLAALIPARRAATISPADALRD